MKALSIHIVSILLTVVLIVLTTPIYGTTSPSKSLSGLGPINFTGQTPLQTLRLDIVPTRLDLLSYGQIEISMFNNITNRWNRTSRYLLDLEVSQNIFSFSLGLGGGFEIATELPILSLSGGFLDRFL